MSFRPKLIVAFGTGLVILISLGVFSFRRTIYQDENQQWVEHTRLVLEKLDGMDINLLNQETNQRGFIITGAESYLRSYESASSRLQQDLQQARALTLDNSQQQRSLDHLEALIVKRSVELRKVPDARGKQDSPLAMHYLQGSTDQLRAVIDHMKEEERRLLRQRQDSAAVGSRRTKSLIITGNVTALFFLFAAIVVIVQELGRRKRAEEALRLSEERFRLLVSGVKDYAIFMLDPDGRVATWNAGAERIKGYKAQEIIGQHFSVFYPREDVERGKPDLELNVATEEGRVEDEGWRLRNDGSRFWADVVITALRDESGRLRGFGKVTRDMTERRHAKEAMEIHNAQLEAANQELQAFSYSVSHDLRAPLRSIDGFSLALLEDYEGKLDSQGKEYLQRIRAATTRMGQLIDGMLSLARISRAEMVRESVDLSPLARDIALELQSSDPARRATFAIASTLPVQGDRRLLRAVLENLLANAWKFSSAKPESHIQVGTTQNGGETIHFVRDNGAGFDMQHADKLFGVFQRLHRDSEFAGNGVGLATVQRIIRRHGGRIWADAVPGQGATFYFVLGREGL
jgi:PAS domain S-box-containing protein